MQNSIIDTPQWALTKIRAAKEKKLEVLDLSLSVAYNPEKLVKLPDEIFELLSLTTLNLSDNGLRTLPELISQLQNLTTLNLRGNILGLGTLPESISQLQNLTTLDLTGNVLGTLPESITRLPSLTTLDLTHNGLSTLPESITRLQNLTTLNLSLNELSSLPESITRLQNLRTLYLSVNPLSSLPESISQLQNLTTLDLTGNLLSTLPESITQLQNLIDLNLSVNGPGNLLSTLPQWITRLQNLTTLHLVHNGLSALPESITQLQNLTHLDLSENLLSRLPESIIQLQNLTHLDLSRSRFSTLPESITRLQNLTTLNLRINLLSTIPESITKLQNLTTLDLRANQFSSLPESITRLQNLTTLDLGGNQLGSLPESITRLQNLTTLYLGGNQITGVPESITRLQNLTTLNLGSNQITAVPESITQLQNLTTLNLGSNQITAVPESITRLQNLTSLYLGGNQFSTFPESITRLQNLTSLDLGNNILGTLPESITRLQNLTTLDLGSDGLSSLPESITQLQNLTTLDLRGNGLSSLPESITRLQNLTSLYLNGNPLISPPIEIAEQGIGAIREYFRQLDQEGVDYIYEAKLLILGEGGAGKTTFANKILDSNYLLKDEDSTRGVDVLKWSFPFEGKKQFNVNIWDFGGQEIYHATHQFFLTKRSLYILVADTRKEDTDFYYWLNVAASLSDASPLIIVKNKKQGREPDINERQLKGQFDGLKEVLATDLATNEGLEKIKEEIKHYLQKLPDIGSPLPKTWVRVREQLEKNQRNHISLDAYLMICEAKGITEIKDSLQLSRYLHDIGVFLHFEKDSLLKKTVILKPKWGTDAVYKVLDNQTVKGNLGRFTHADLERIWDAPEYQMMRDDLLKLMMKFKLCYEIPSQEGTYIAPQLLTKDQPVYEWEDQENLLLRYTYHELMPKGILTQFIVVMHPHIWNQRIVWKSGVVIEKDRTRAEVIEYYGKREIQVRVAGEQRRDLMTLIRYELKQIHDTYSRLKYDELIQCNCASCKGNPEPNFYSIADLMDFRANGQSEIQCRKKPYHMVNVMRLLGDVIDLSTLSEKKDVTVMNIENYYEKGDNKMTEINQHIEGSTIYGSVVAAESIKDSFNTIQKADINDGLKEQLTQLTQAVDAMIKEKLKEQPKQAEKVGVYIQRLSEEATKEKPDSEWYSVSINGLIAAAQNLGKVGDAVIELSGKVRKILTGGML